MKSLGLALGLCVAIGGCGTPTAPEPEPFRSAPEILTMAGAPVAVRVGLFRDFQPRSPELDGGSTLSASVLIGVPLRDEYPSPIAEAYIWVRNGDQIWFDRLRPMSTVRPSDSEIFAVDGGPQWPTNIRVDVVVGVRDQNGATSQCIKKQVLIVQAD